MNADICECVNMKPPQKKVFWRLVYLWVNKLPTLNVPVLISNHHQSNDNMLCYIFWIIFNFKMKRKSDKKSSHSLTARSVLFHIYVTSLEDEIYFKNITKKMSRIKNVSLFFGGKFRVLIQMESICSFFK